MNATATTTNPDKQKLIDALNGRGSVSKALAPKTSKKTAKTSKTAAPRKRGSSKKATSGAKTEVTIPKSAPKPKKDQSSGAFIQEQLLAGTSLTDAQLAKIVVRHYPDRTTSVKDVQWNRWKLRKEGRLPPRGAANSKKAA